MATTDARAALQGADFCIHAVPVQFSAAVLENISEHVTPKLPFVSVSKGLELNTLRMMSQIIPRALENPFQPVVVLSGPSFAVELMDKLPTGFIKDSYVLMPESKEQM
jgi:glycerol-3-phosphate dehydrogenase (NAD+)